MYKTHEVNPYTCCRWQSQHFTISLNFSGSQKITVRIKNFLSMAFTFFTLRYISRWHKILMKCRIISLIYLWYTKHEKCSSQMWDAREPSWQHSSLCEVEAFVVNTRKAVERGNGVWNHYRKCMLKQGLSQIWLP